MNIRQAQEKDVSRIAEILVYNNRVNFFPIFKDEDYSFGKLQVMSVAHEYLQDKERLQNTFVFDDGVIRFYPAFRPGNPETLCRHFFPKYGDRSRFDLLCSKGKAK